nr:MAG TPA: hypothetical protein [Caudoviricetes sp.]
MLAILLSKLIIEYLETKLFLLALMLRKMLDRMQMTKRSLLGSKQIIRKKLKDRVKITLLKLRSSRSRLELRMQRNLSLTI